MNDPINIVIDGNDLALGLYFLGAGLMSLAVSAASEARDLRVGCWLRLALAVFWPVVVVALMLDAIVGQGRLAVAKVILIMKGGR